MTYSEIRLDFHNHGMESWDWPVNVQSVAKHGISLTGQLKFCSEENIPGGSLMSGTTRASLCKRSPFQTIQTKQQNRQEKDESRHLQHFPDNLQRSQKSEGRHPGAIEFASQATKPKTEIMKYKVVCSLGLVSEETIQWWNKLSLPCEDYFDL